MCLLCSCRSWSLILLNCCMLPPNGRFVYVCERMCVCLCVALCVCLYEFVSVCCCVLLCVAVCCCVLLCVCPFVCCFVVTIMCLCVIKSSCMFSQRVMQLSCNNTSNYDYGSAYDNYENFDHIPQSHSFMTSNPLMMTQTLPSYAAWVYFRAFQRQ